MHRRTMLGLLPAASGGGTAAAARHGVVYRSPDAARIYAYSPGITRLASGRLIATLDLGAVEGGGIQGFTPGEGSGTAGGGRFTRLAQLYTSDDRGRSWLLRGEAPMLHGRPFEAGNAVYFLGHANDLAVLRSRDNGSAWSEPHFLTRGESYHQAPSNVWYHEGRVYLVMERITDRTFRGWPVNVLAPVVLSARTADDLTQPSAWTFSNALSFREAAAAAGPPRGVGIPFFAEGPTAPKEAGGPRSMSRWGWLETHIVQFRDPAHVWHHASGRVLHLLARAHTGSANWACLARVDESEDRRKLAVSVERAPSGEPLLFLPLPGGHLKFHILWDEPTRLFWLVSNQATDSMRRPEMLPGERYGLPNNERHRLVLHFSKNAVDWLYAGPIADSGSPAQARNYPAACIDGGDLHIVCRSGDRHARNAHDGNLITFHTVRRFRDRAF